MNGVNILGDEKFQPVHAADVEKMVEAYRLRSPIMIQKSSGAIEVILTISALDALSLFLQANYYKIVICPSHEISLHF